jgi:hypothetical protein
MKEKGRRGLRGSQEEVGWRVRVVLRLRSLSFIIIIKFIKYISTTQTQIQSTFLQNLRETTRENVRPGTHYQNSQHA